MGALKQKSRVSPRYRFSDKDNEAIRFINSKHARILSTVIIDISETGVGFLTAMKYAPQIGEIIKMDFAPLGSVRMACQGKVVHISTPPANSGWSKYPGTVKIGVQFYDMPKEYRRALIEILKGAFLKSGREISQFRSLSESAPRQERSWFIQNIWSILGSILILAGAAYGAYYFVNFDPKERDVTQDTGWATNFFERTLKK